MLERLRLCFARTQTWQHAGRYLSALVSQVPKRNGWTIAEHVGDHAPDRTQRLLNRAVWDTLGAMSQVRRFVAAGLDAAGDRKQRRGLVVAALDETGQAKAGAERQQPHGDAEGCAGQCRYEIGHGGGECCVAA